MTNNFPSFKGLKPANDISSRSKRANKKTDTKQELLLRKTLWHMGLRYRKNVSTIVGKPDIVFPGAKVVVFCDGDFWHGRNWDTLKTKLEGGSNSAYWIKKIQTNIERDKKITSQLEQAGWLVIRVWEGDIKNDANAIANKVKALVIQRKINK